MRYGFPTSLAGRFEHIDVTYERHTGVSFRRGGILSVLDLVGVTVAFFKAYDRAAPYGLLRGDDGTARIDPPVVRVRVTRDLQYIPRRFRIEMRQ